MSYADPKHGRWILPLIIAGMIVLTYTFVNSLEPAQSPTDTTQAEPPFPTVPTTTTTTLPPEIQAWMVTLNIFENQARTFGEEVLRINGAWDPAETRTATFAETRTAFADLRTLIRNWESDVAQLGNVPSQFAEGHVQLVIAVSQLSVKMDDVISGLEAPDDGTLRRAAVAEFGELVQDVLDVIDALRQAAAAEFPAEAPVEDDDADQADQAEEAGA